MKAPILFLTTFLCFACGSGWAQMYVGPIAGGQLSWIKFDDDALYDAYETRPVPGYHAGASFSLKVRNRFFLHTSFLYSTKGKKVEGKYDPLLRNKVRYEYIEMPIIYSVDFRGRLGSGKEFKYYLGIGPNVSYWLGGKGSLYNSDLDENADFASRDLEYRIAFGEPSVEARPDRMMVAEPNRIQLGLNVASGIVFEPRPDQRILIMLRYELGHSFLSRTNGVLPPTYYEDVLQSRNKGVRLSASWLFDLQVEKRKRGKSTIKVKKMK